MSESALERRCVRAARVAGGELLKVLPWAISGLPDRLLILPGGAHTWIEFKAPKGLLTPMQQHWRDRLLYLGCDHRVVRSWEDFEAALMGRK
jgi:hypothetical protein